MAVTPAWGLKYVAPEDAIAAWGARLIVTQDGTVDLVPDRQGTDGGPHSQEILAELNKRFAWGQLSAVIRELLVGIRFPDGERVRMGTREEEDFILYLDDRLVIHANTNASAGYCYVTAWLYPEAS